MTAIEPSGQILGATVRGMDLAKPLSDADFATRSACSQISSRTGSRSDLPMPGRTGTPTCRTTKRSAYERTVRRESAAPRRQAAGRHPVREHARGLRRSRAGVESAAQERHRDARLQQVLGSDAAATGQQAPGSHRAAAPDAAAIGASGIPHAPDHRPQGALLQSRLRDPHQRARRGGQRPRDRAPDPAPTAAEVPGTRTHGPRTMS